MHPARAGRANVSKFRADAWCSAESRCRRAKRKRRQTGHKISRPGSAFDLRENKRGILADDGVDGEGAEDRGENDAADERAVQVLDDLFEHEGDGGERSVKGSGQPGGGAGGGRAAATLFRDAEQPRSVAEATPPAMCTEGPSRPRLMPPPTWSNPATNFTTMVFSLTNPKSCQKASLELGNAAAGRALVDAIHEKAAA